MRHDHTCFSVLFALALAAISVPAAADWEFMPSPAPGTGTNILYAADGIGGADAWAVGYQRDSGTSSGIRTLTLHFDGVSWTHVPSPNPDPDPTPYNDLNGVVATGPDSAIAVGSYTPAGGVSQTLALEWDGSDWSVISSPFQDGGSTFYDITETPQGDLWASGSWVSDTTALSEGMIAMKNGGGWTVEGAPIVGYFRNRFYDVSALSNDEIWVVGTQGDDYGDFKILIQRYDGGSSWTTFDVPTPGWTDSLQGVTALSSDDVWAAGYYYDPALFLYQPLIMHFDGTGWEQVVLPSYPEGSCELRDIEALSADDIIAAGTYATADGIPRPFALHFDGTAWTEIDLPSTGGGYEWFRGVGATPDGDAMIVGQYFDGSLTAPVIFRRPAPAPATLACDFTCSQTSGTLPFPLGMTVTLTNLRKDGSRRLAGRIDILTGGGTSYSNWRSGSTTLPPLGSHVSSWTQNLPALGTLVGTNVFTLTAEDVTPPPFNQPPYAPSGDVVTKSVAVEAAAP